MPARRDVLAATGGTAIGAVTAGCSRLGGRSLAVDVTAVSHRHSAFYVDTDVRRVQTFDGQVVLARVDASEAESPPAFDDIALVGDDEPYSPCRNLVTRGTGPSGVQMERAYAVDRGTGWLVFPVPCPLDADDPRIRFPAGSWPLPESVRTALAEPRPSFDLVSFDHPEAVVVGEPTTVVATVEHAGGPGPVRLAFSQWARTGQGVRRTESVPGSGSARVSATFDGPAERPDDGQAVLSLAGPAIDARAELPVREAS